MCSNFVGISLILAEHVLIMFAPLGSFFFFLHIFVLVAFYKKPANSINTPCLVLNSLSLEPTSHILQFIQVKCENLEKLQIVVTVFWHPMRGLIKRK